MAIFDEVKSIELFAQEASVLPNADVAEFQKVCEYVAAMQRAVLWWIGDLAIAAERQLKDRHFQVWPEWVSPDMIDRCKAVSLAYRPEERNIHATWTTHMQLSKRPDRVEAVQASVEAGQTSDDVRRNPPPPVEKTEQEEPPAVQQPEEPAAGSQPSAVIGTITEVTPPAESQPKSESTDWLLAIDVNYYAHKLFAKAGVDTATQVVKWMERLIERLQKTKNLTDVVFCFDSTRNHRRELTDGWEQPYKERTVKDPELVEQLLQIPELLKRNNWLCVSIDGMEADDVMASYATQFDGKVTLMTADKDLRQCLSDKCNILRDMDWETHAETGALMPVYKWVISRWEGPPEKKPASVTCHMTDVLNYSGAAVKGITPQLWPHFQAIAGDNGDDIKGVAGIGGKIAMDLILAHGTVQEVIAACKDNRANLTALKRTAVLDFEPFAETTLKLTTMRTDLPVPMTTKLCTGEAGK